MSKWFAAFVLGMSFTQGAASEPVVASALSPVNVTQPGHSMIGESFDEGPRHSAKLLGTTGRVTFPISTSSQQAQQFFNQGIGQLHGFWYFEAERSFRQAATLDPECAMSYFGMALANVNNDQRAKGFVAEAVKRKTQATSREKMYIEALEAWYKAEVGDDVQRKTRSQNFVVAIENLLYQYPEDLEAKAMLALTLWQRRELLEMGGYYAIDALMNDVLAVNPYHPIHHYRIHLWDHDKSKLATNSAERCGLSAPGVAHMWHMSGHTFSELKQYFDAAWHQEAATRTDHAYMIRDGIFPDRIHNFAHNNEWLCTNLQYLGRVHDAILLAKNMIELPRHPKLNTLTGHASAYHGRIRLFQIYSQFELWDQMIADTQTQILEPTAEDAEQVKYFRHLGRAYFRKQDAANGNVTLALLERRQRRLQQESDRALEKEVAKVRFNGGDAKALEAAQTQAKQPTAGRIQILERAVQELRGYVQLAAGKPADALDLLQKAGDVDEAYLAEVEFLAGKSDDALKRLRDWVGSSRNQVRPLATLVQMLWRLEKKDEAKQVLETLREISGGIDLDVPPFARLQPIAAGLGLSNDWRKPKLLPRNIAELPDLSTLGPLTWHPTSAADWSLPDGDGTLHSLVEYRGRPVVVIFYLGFGCLHCAEQLQAFAPKSKEYSAAGISVIAISSDSVPNLKKSQEKYKSTEGSFPFLLVSDASLEVFKRYQAYDDFENTALHATLLIDGAGKIRWHDSGPEPFMNVDFLLQESNRLLHPERIQRPTEPDLLDETLPADALDPMNFFGTPPIAPAPTNREKQREVATGG